MDGIWIPELDMMALHMKLAVFLALIAVGACNQCKYLKFTPLHSYCLPPNPNCKLLDTGVTNADKDRIVRLHNEYREKVAIGHERHAGRMPKAANMMEMEWDNELAAVAQKHAEQCKFEHDCYQCRQVDRFIVGQNIYMAFTFSMPIDTDWPGAIKAFYDEVKTFKREYIKPFVFGSYGHFTQVVWATSWRVGCGRAVFKDGDWYKTFLVCNYGPAGNMMGGEMYQEGSPCSACPSGTCCGSSCRRSGIQSKYRGLCKAIDVDTFRI